MEGEMKKSGVGGRPPKFCEPRHAVTMTLPVRILDQLAEIDPDRTRAVVKVTTAVMGADQKRFKPVELVEMAPGESLIVVGPNKALKQIPWLKLIEIAPARFLLTIPIGTPIEVLEVALGDLFNNPKLLSSEGETSVLRELLNLLGHKRRTLKVSKAEILIVDTR
jgi:hypothetical protein